MVEFETSNKDTSEDVAVGEAKIDSLVTENNKLHAFIEKLGQTLTLKIVERSSVKWGKDNKELRKIKKKKN